VFSTSSHASDPSPQELEAAQAGDRGALERIASSLLPRVRNLVRYLIRGDREVEDVAQEALVTVLRGLHSYRGDGAFRSWVDRVVARSTFAWLERRKTREQRSLELLDQAGSEAEVRQPDEYLERRRVVQVLDSLPEEQRHALVLHHVLEMSVPEIAETTGSPVETVRSRLRLGRGRMRATLAPTTSQKVS
jgi:RNA polymerase sigma-70 factor (ECF subfamily)